MQALETEAAGKDLLIQELTEKLAEKDTRIAELSASAAVFTGENEVTAPVSAPDNSDGEAQSIPDHGTDSVDSEALSKEIQARDEEIKNLKADNDNKSLMIFTLNAGIDEKDAQIRSLNDELSEKNEQIKALQSLSSTHESDAESLSPDTDGKQENVLPSDVRSLEEELKTLKSENEEKALLIFSLSAGNEEKESQIQTLNDDLAEMSGQLETLQALIAEKDAAAESLSAALADKESQISTQESDLTALTQQVEMLNSDLAVREEKIKNLEASLSDRENELISLQASLAEAEQRSAVLSESVSDTVSQDASADAAALSDENIALKEQLNEYEKRIDELQNLFISTFAASSGTSLSLSEDGDITVIKRFRIRDTDSPNVHKNPAFSSRVIGHARASKEYEILDVSSNGWYQILLENGKTGWVHPNVGTLNVLEFSFIRNGSDQVQP